VIGYSGVFHLWVGSAGSYAEKAFLNTAFGADAAIGDVTCGFGKWRVTGRIAGDGGRAWMWLITLDGGTVSANQALERDFDIHTVYGAGSTPFAFAARESHNGLYKYTNNLLDPAPAYINEDLYQGAGFAVSPDGMQCMCQWSTGKRGLSGDGGTTWSGIPSLPVDAGYHFEYAGAGDSAASSHWIAAHAVIRYSEDFGVTWQNKEGNISALWPIVSFNMVKVVPS
jgi:hypothetical protein